MIYEILPIVWFEIGALFRRKRTFIALFLYLASAASLVFGIAFLQGELERAFLNLQVENSEISRLLKEIYSRARGVPHKEIDAIIAIVSEWPVSVWLFQIFSLLLMPSLIALMSSDIIAIDIYRRTVRLVLLKCRRSSYYLGKIFAHFLLYSLLQLGSVATMAFLTSYYGSPYSLGFIIRAGLISYLFFLPFLFVAVALTTWISSWCNRPQSALILVHGIWMLLLCVAFYYPQVTPFNIGLLSGILFPLQANLLQLLSTFSLWIGGLLLVGLLGFMYREV